MERENQEELHWWIKQMADPNCPSDQIMVRLPGTPIVFCLPPDVPTSLAIPLFKLCYLSHEVIARMDGHHFASINQFLSKLPERFQSPMVNEMAVFRGICESSTFEDLEALQYELSKSVYDKFRMVAQVYWLTPRQEGEPVPGLDWSSIFDLKQGP
jgi:hypothetical protein